MRDVWPPSCFRPSPFGEARGALVAKYGEPDAFFAYQPDARAWKNADAWRQGEPGGALWNLQGGTVQLASLDGSTIIVRYVPAAAQAMETDNY